MGTRKWKILTAWILIAAMTLGNLSFPAKANQEEDASELVFTIEPMENEGIREWDGERKLVIYEGQSITVIPENTEVPIEWSVYDRGDFEENGIESATEIEDAVTIEPQTDPANTYLLRAGLLEDEEGKNYVLYARGTADGDNLSRSLFLHICKQRFQYDYPLCSTGENYVFPTRDLSIDSHMGCWVENPAYPDGEYLDDVEVISAEVTDGEEVLECNSNGDGSYQLYGKSCGRAEIKVSYAPVSGDDGADFYTREIFVTNDIYYLNWEYPEGTDMMLKNKEMTIEYSLTHGHFDRDEKTEEEYEDWEEIEEYSLELEEDSYDKNVIDVSINGHSMTIIAKDYGSTSIFLRGKIDGEYCGEAEIGINVTDYYRNLLPASVENVPLGGTLDLGSIAWQLMLYDDETHSDGLDISDTWEGERGRIRLVDYDENAWEIKANTKDETLPTLIRKGNWGTKIGVAVECNYLDENGDRQRDEDGELLWEELGGRDLWFDGLDYSVDFAQNYGDPDNHRIFIGEPLTLTLKTAEYSEYELPADYTVEWQLIQYQEDGTESMPDFITIVPDDSTHSATLSVQSENANELVGTWFDVRAVVSYKETELTSFQSGFEVMEQGYYYDEPLSEPGGNQMLYGGELYIAPFMHCWAENANNPYGIDLEQAITKVEIVGNYIWDDEQGDWSEADAETVIVRIEGNANDGWTIFGNEYGMARLKITYDKAGGDPDSNEREIEVYVSGDIYRMQWNFPEGEDGQMLLDSEMTLTDFSIVHEVINEDNNEYVSTDVTNFSLSVEFDEGDPTYNTDLLDVTADDKKLIIRSKDQTGSENIYLRAMRGNEELCGVNIHIDVEEEFYRIFSDEVVAEPGEMRSIEEFHPSIRRYTADCPDGDEIDAAFRFSEDSDENIAFTQDCITISEDFELEEDLPQEILIRVYADLKDTEGTIERDVRLLLCKHDWQEKDTAQAPTCETDGAQTFVCRHCETEKTELIPALGHNWSAWTTKETATVLKKETQTRTCSVCGTIESRDYGDLLTATMKTASGLKMKTGQKATVLLVIDMAEGDSVVSIVSDKSQILKVSNVKSSGSCKLSAQKKTGIAKLTIRLASGLEKTIKVTVQKGVVKTTKISGLPKKLTLKKGETYQLAAVLTPLTSQQKLTYSSSNKAAVTVNGKGMLKAKKAGKAKITVKSGSKKAVVNVTVN